MKTFAGLKLFSSLSSRRSSFHSTKKTFRFIETSCKSLTVLKLDNFSLATEQVLASITSTCSSLTHLSLSSCQLIPSYSFEHIKHLTNLTNLNLYRTCIDDNSLFEIIAFCKRLKVLNLGSCVNVRDFDTVMEVLSASAPQIESLDLWRAYSLSQYGMLKLTKSCSHIQELDIGWA
jgi:hypothetical protein